MAEDICGFIVLIPHPAAVAETDETARVTREAVHALVWVCATEELLKCVCVCVVVLGITH